MLFKLFTFFICLNISFSVTAKGNFIVYTEAFDVFQIVDGLSMWKERTPNEYHDFYKKKFGITSADKAMLQKYITIRKKYYKEYPQTENSIFSDTKISSDIISRTFASVSTLDQGLMILKKKNRMKLEDIKELVKVYKYFKKNISVIVKESSLLNSEAKRLSKLVKKSKLSSNIKKLDKFFNFPSSKFKGGRIKLVWWPKTESPSVDFLGGRVILRVNPIKHSSMLTQEFLSKVLVQSLLISQGKTIKENLSKVFIDGCPSIKDKALSKDMWFETPLVEALYKYYLPQLTLKKKFNPYTLQSEGAWLDIYSKYLYGLTQFSVKRRAQFDREFVSNSAKFCENLLNL